MDQTNLEPGSPVPRAPSDPLNEPRSLGDYRILRKLGEGGMGAVYLAFDEAQSRQVAIKILSDPLASSQAYVDRFNREARSALLLNHPNIVRGYNVGQDKATTKHYLVLEYVDGPSVLSLLDRFGRLAVGDAVHVALDVARALEYAHSRNFVHRDIKPDNILITLSGVAKLSDLGLAKRIDEASHLTATRQGFGTPYYMPYEQAINAKYADARSDIYALGATLFHLVTGEVPFSGVNHLEVMDKKNVGVYPPASSLNPEVPPLLDHILARMLAREPRQRYQTASELIVDLERSLLAAPMLSFADPDLAMKDPWLQACMTSSAQPTLPDLEGLAKAKETNGNGDQWFVRHRTHQGEWRQIRATTKQIVKQLRAGRLPALVEASHQADSGFQQLSEYPEFRDVQPARARRKKPRRGPNSKRREERTTEAVPSEQAEGRRSSWLPVGAGAGVVLLLAGALLYWLVLGHH
jgi:serine/threonine protein kinase